MLQDLEQFILRYFSVIYKKLAINSKSLFTYYISGRRWNPAICRERTPCDRSLVQVSTNRSIIPQFWSPHSLNLTSLLSDLRSFY